MATLMEHTRIPTDPRDEAWGPPGWPHQFTGFRSHQIDAWEEIMEHFDNGVEVVLLDAPTGAGKTCIAEGVRRLLEVKTALYVANTNSLVDQFAKDFDYAKRLKGRANYETLDKPGLFVAGDRNSLSAADCSLTLAYLPACSTCDESSEEADDDDEFTKQLHCNHCHPVKDCPYRVARAGAMQSALCVTNTSYFISDAGLGTNSGLKGRQLIIADECDTLESILMGHVEVNLTKKMCRELDINPPSKKTVEEAWGEWLADEGVPKVMKAYSALSGKCKGREMAPAEKKEEVKLTRLMSKMRVLKKELERGNAVYDGYANGDIIFKPIKVDHLAPKLLWENGRRWLCMSATLFPDEFVDSTGLELTDKEYATVRVPSTFPVDRRPIYYKGVASNTYKNRDSAWPKIAEGVLKVLEMYPEERVLVHTVSYGFTDYLAQALYDAFVDRDVITYKGATERELGLEKLADSDAGVLLAPSMDRGIDLPGDACRVVIVVKMPFMSTADKQVNARMYSRGGREWYSVQTLKSLVQMTGRGMRSEDDFCFTYILDSQFLDNVWKNNRRLMPEWWTESVDWGGGGL